LAAAWVTAAGGTALAAQGGPAGDAFKGKQLYASECAVCHKDKSSSLGPALRGIYGRRAGQVTDFKYSDGMKTANRTWDNKTLDPFLAAPTKAVPGATMSAHVPKSQDRADIIAYLKTLKIAARRT
jgi:cytochrome c